MKIFKSLFLLCFVTALLSCSQKPLEDRIVEKISAEIGNFVKSYTDENPKVFIWREFTLPFPTRLKDIVDKEFGALPSEKKGDSVFKWENTDYQITLEQGGWENDKKEIVLQAKIFFRKK